MSVNESEEIKCAVISDKDKSITPKQCNKFSIENILGLTDNETLTKVNRVELIRFGRKGRERRETLRLNRNAES
jgi:hypothetical protein